MAQIWPQHCLQEPNMDQHRPNIGSIYAQHGPGMVQKRRVPFGPGKGLKGTRARIWPQHSLQEPNMDQHRPNIGSIYAQHGPGMIQKRRVPFGPGKGLKGTRRFCLNISATWLKHGPNIASKSLTWINIGPTLAPYTPNMVPT